MEKQKKGTILEFFARQKLKSERQDGDDVMILVECPVCGAKVPERRINLHLDHECTLEMANCKKNVGRNGVTSSKSSPGASPSSVKMKDQDPIKENGAISPYFKQHGTMVTPPPPALLARSLNTTGIFSPAQSTPPSARRRLSLSDQRLQKSPGRINPLVAQGIVPGSAVAGRLQGAAGHSFAATVPGQKQSSAFPTGRAEQSGAETCDLRNQKRAHDSQTAELVRVEGSIPGLQSRRGSSSWATAGQVNSETGRLATTPRKESTTPSKSDNRLVEMTTPRKKRRTECRSSSKTSPLNRKRRTDEVKRSPAAAIFATPRKSGSKRAAAGLATPKSKSPRRWTPPNRARGAGRSTTPSNSQPVFSTPTKSPRDSGPSTDFGTPRRGSSQSPGLMSPRKKRFLAKIPSCFQDLRKSLAASPHKSTLDYPDEDVVIPDRSDVEGVGCSERDFRLCYYLDNFLDILKAVLDVPDDLELFDEDDLIVVRRFYLLSDPGQELFVRLIARKHKWLRKVSIKYPEIGDDLQAFWDELTDAGFVEKEDSLHDLKTMLRLLPAQSTKKLCQSLNVKAGSQKKGAVAQLMEHCSNQPSILEMFGSSSSVQSAVAARAKKLLGSCFRLRDEVRRVFIRVMMLYSLTDTVADDNKNDDAPTQLTTLLMINMGRWIFPPYRILRQTRILRSRADLLEFEKAFSLEGNIVTAIEAKDWTSAAALCDEAVECYAEFQTKEDALNHDVGLPKFLRRFTTGHVLTRCLNQRVELLQKMHLYEEADQQLRQLLDQEVYCQTYRGHWVERLALNLDQHLKRPLEALEIIAGGLEDERLTTNHKFSLYQRGRRILSAKKYRQEVKDTLKDMPAVTLTKADECHIEGTVIPKHVPGYKTLFLCKEESDSGNVSDIVICSVEERALMHYRKQGYPNGVHGEGAALVSLFGLLLWDIIYGPGVPDAFRSSHQSYPLDLVSQEFYTNRRAAIDERLQLLRSSSVEELVDRVGQSWRSHEGQTSLVNWELYGSYQKAQSLVTCIGSECLACICERFAKNYRHFRSGVPDLTVWNPAAQEWKMVEVKGPGDRLSTKQCVWLDYLNGIGVHVEVCYVKATGSKTIKKKTVGNEVSQLPATQAEQARELPVNEY